MADVVTSREGDTLDGLLWRERRLDASALDAVLAVNRDLAALGPVLPRGTKVTVPATSTSSTTPIRDVVQLWDD